ncbi:MAG TPA: 2-oxo-4-hydroxy-4-carboxy-5-ureidoimidazoline decarboxylase [Conexibacter sp.]|nr:2-oxo-4-hydroxy-4-carboxy-5-ureidoimidazoline decarboxylase [Conexibacter sp.]
MSAAAAVDAPIGLDALNALDRDAFVARVGFAYEASPWVAEAAWERRPFASVAHLRAALRRAVEEAPAERQLALIRAHPDLADRAAVAAGALTPASRAEQTGAGLDRLAPDLHERLLRANAAYRERFGFPFVICVREHTAGAIVAHAERRLRNDARRERRVALEEITKIAGLRLQAAVVDREDSSCRSSTSR